MAQNNKIPRYPKIEISLTHLEGNALALVSMARQSMQDVWISDEIIDQFTKEAYASIDHDQIIETVKRWVTVR